MNAGEEVKAFSEFSSLYEAVDKFSVLHNSLKSHILLKLILIVYNILLSLLILGISFQNTWHHILLIALSFVIVTFNTFRVREIWLKLKNQCDDFEAKIKIFSIGSKHFLRWCYVKNVHALSCEVIQLLSEQFPYIKYEFDLNNSLFLVTSEALPVLFNITCAVMIISAHPFLLYSAQILLLVILFLSIIDQKYFCGTEYFENKGQDLMDSFSKFGSTIGFNYESERSSCEDSKYRSSKWLNILLNFLDHLKIYHQVIFGKVNKLFQLGRNLIKLCISRKYSDEELIFKEQDKKETQERKKNGPSSYQEKTSSNSQLENLNENEHDDKNVAESEIGKDWEIPESLTVQRREEPEVQDIVSDEESATQLESELEDDKRDGRSAEVINEEENENQKSKIPEQGAFKGQSSQESLNAELGQNQDHDMTRKVTEEIHERNKNGHPRTYVFLYTNSQLENMNENEHADKRNVEESEIGKESESSESLIVRGRDEPEFRDVARDEESSTQAESQLDAVKPDGRNDEAINEKENEDQENKIPEQGAFNGQSSQESLDTELGQNQDHDVTRKVTEEIQERSKNGQNSYKEKAFSNSYLGNMNENEHDDKNVKENEMEKDWESPESLIAQGREEPEFRNVVSDEESATQVKSELDDDKRDGRSHEVLNEKENKDQEKKIPEQGPFKGQSSEESLNTELVQNKDNNVTRKETEEIQERSKNGQSSDKEKASSNSQLENMNENEHDDKNVKENEMEKDWEIPESLIAQGREEPEIRDVFSDEESATQVESELDDVNRDGRRDEVINERENEDQEKKIPEQGPFKGQSSEELFITELGQNKDNDVARKVTEQIQERSKNGQSSDKEKTSSNSHLENMNENENDDKNAEENEIGKDWESPESLTVQEGEEPEVRDDVSDEESSAQVENQLVDEKRDGRRAEVINEKENEDQENKIPEQGPFKKQSCQESLNTDIGQKRIMT